MKNRLLILMSGVAVLGITSCTKPTYQYILTMAFGCPVLKQTVRFPFLPLLRNVRRTAVLITLLLQAD